ncbi:putative tetratricopeptide repeat protein 41 isoform X2 [Erinaceus europaeus]|uniref:Tetratricopeptide repeat protein 41 isoform X2 n=1 Tax=Erinaceus europaeus TaxID=9365 RepID=A0ABM3XN86_ERIEU|nr:putative tetratricopeptide repeat protein 41 isoform X2 [Erinaceus europaeus]
MPAPDLQSAMNRKSNTNTDKRTQFLSESRKPIRPYVCSTLHDFQEERDFLATNIFPQLNDVCSSRGTYFRAVDLKWAGWQGLAPSPSSRLPQHACLQSQHLKLCLDHVNSCFPFFICLLGQTYGDFLPACSPFMFSRTADPSDLLTVQQNLYVAAQNGYPWVLENPNCSLTEYEITQAAFLRKSPFLYFYFRTGTTLLKALNEAREGQLSSVSLLNDEGQLKLGKLKAKIIGKGFPVRFYRDLPELGELVFKDWLVVIEKLYPVTSTMENIDHKHNFERLFHKEFTEKCKEVFVASKESSKTFEILGKFALEVVKSDLSKEAAGSSFESILRENSSPTYKSILLLSGDRGCGKSTLIASWVNHFQRSHPDALVIPHFVGSTCESSDLMSVMHYFIMELHCRHYGTLLEADIFNEEANVLVFSLLVEVFIAAISLRPCIIVLDGIEDLVGIYGISGQKSRDFSWLPPSLPPHCKLILTTVPSSLSYKSLCTRPDVMVVRLTNTGDEEAKLSIFRQHFSIPGYEEPFQLTLTVQDQRKNTSLNPLKLAVLATELRESRLYRDEAKCLQEYLGVASVQELWELVLQRWSKDYGFQQDPADSNTVASGQGLSDWVADVLCLLSVSHCGLTEEEILQLLETLGYRNQYRVTPMHWAAFRSASKQWVQEKPSGLLYFQHQTLRNTVEHKLLGVITPVRESYPRTFQRPTSHKKTYFHRMLVRYFQRQASFWRVYEELPWHMKMSSCWQGLCSFLSSPSITDFLSKIQSPSFWAGLHLIHYWNTLSDAGYDLTEAYQLTVTKVRVTRRRKSKKRNSNSVLESKPSEVTLADKCQIVFFIGRFLKFMGKTREAESLFLSTEDTLEKSGSITEMLVRVQNTIGELYLQIGMAQEGFQYFQKAWWNLIQFPPSNFRDNQDLVKQKGRVLNNLVRTASEEYLQDSHLLERASDISSLLDNNPWDQATMKYTEGVLILATGHSYQAKRKLHECLTIRRSLLGLTSATLTGQCQSC